jgi:purine-nucleoside phosphorylase
MFPMADLSTYAGLVAQARGRPPDAALVLGSGMGGLAERCRVLCRLPFVEVPGLAATSVVGHAGGLTLGDWAGKRVLLFEGRLHFYEGHPWRSVVEPVEAAHYLGAPVLLVTNAAGGIHDALGPGSLMAIRDHIEWTRPWCWRRPGPNGLDGPGPSPYSPRLLRLLKQAAADLHVDLAAGTYAAVTGPCYETPAEIRALRAWGADAVGMSTAREVQRAYDLGLECAAVSLVTNRAAGLSTGPIQHEEVLATAAASSARLARLLEGFLRLL